MRAVFPRDEEEFSFTKAEFEVMSNGDVCRYLEMRVSTTRHNQDVNPFHRRNSSENDRPAVVWRLKRDLQTQTRVGLLAR